jgi:hypothetical protein
MTATVVIGPSVPREGKPLGEDFSLHCGDA